MRWLVLVGSFLFAYLALLPGGLVISTLDPACAGPECDQPLAEDILLGALYAACLAAVLASSVTMAVYFFRTTVRNEERIRQALVATLAAVGLTLLAQFALTSPFAALFTVAVGAAVYGTLRRLNAPAKPDGPKDPSANGHGKLNGHPG